MAGVIPYDNLWYESWIFIIGLLSFLGSIILIFSACFFKDLRRWPSRLLVYLSISSLIATSSAWITSLVGIRTIFDNPSYCHLQALGLIFGFVALYCWYALLVFNMWQSTVKNDIHTER